jgi:plastocyanin
MKKIAFTLALSLSLIIVQAQIVITEIMYNPPESGTDSTEYIELTNIGDEAVNLLNYSFSQGVEMIFEDVSIAPGEYLVVTKSNSAFKAYFGFDAIEWTDGSLSNSGEDIILVDASGLEVDLVDYDDGGSWPVEPDGSGFSLELCDPTIDNNDPINWKPSRTDAGFEIEGIKVFASPGMKNEVPCDNIIDHTIDVLSLQFDPKNLTINLNETVQWINMEGGNHNVNGSQSAYPDNPEGFYSGAPSTDNWTFIHKFTNPGIYKYKSDLYAAFGMTATIEVLPAEAGKLMISEIMYNDPGDSDSLEFIELQNIGSNDINLANFSLISDKIDYTFPDITIKANDFLVLCQNSDVFFNHFGFEAISWGDSLLKNTGDHIILFNVEGNTVDEVEYDDILPWPTEGDGLGSSINLCRPELDNNTAESWQACPVPNRTYINDLEIFASPGKASYCFYDVAEISELNEDGSLLHEDLGVELVGTVHGINLRPGALQITIIDDFNDGIALFSSSNDFGYQVNEGDRLFILGKTGQYNGLAQVYLDTVFFYNQQYPTVDPLTVTTLDETTESQLVKLEKVRVVDPEDWGSGSSGFNVEVTDGTNNYMLRIDNDVDVFQESYPVGTFDVVGIGGQFDNSPPYFDGYQLLPRYMEDFDPYIAFEIPTYTIGQITSNDTNGKADSLGVRCFIEGTVYGINLSGSGLSFTLIDDNNDGINVYSGGNSTGYEVTEGDRLRIKGIVDQYNGLTEFSPEEIEVISTDNPLHDPTLVVDLNESTESQLVKILMVTLVDENQWKGDGSSFNVDVINLNNLYVLRIDNDSELSSMEAPEGLFNVTGIGGQYDTSEPYTDGYQLFPRYASDIDLIENTTVINDPDAVEIYPNPVTEQFSYKTGYLVDEIFIYDFFGQKLKAIDVKDNEPLSFKGLNPGYYVVVFKTEVGLMIRRVLKIE